MEDADWHYRGLRGFIYDKNKQYYAIRVNILLISPSIRPYMDFIVALSVIVA